MDKVGKKIKVAEVIGKAFNGGVINCVYNFFCCLNKDKFSIDFYTYGKTLHEEEILEQGGRVFKFYSVFRFIKCIFNLRKKFKAEKYDIVHVHMSTLSFVPLCAAWLAGVKVRICHAHTMGHRKEGIRYIVKKLFRPLCKLFATHLAGCCEMANIWNYGKKKGKKAFVLHNAVKPENFIYDSDFATSMREEYGLSSKKIIGNVGRIEKQKNPFYTVEIFAELCKVRQDLELIIIGKGSLLTKLKKRVEKLNISDKVLYFYDENGVNKTYSVFDVFLLPSLYEGLPLVLVEAQINGLPCVVSDKLTKEVTFSDLIEFLPLKDKKVWVERLLKAIDKGRRFYDIDWKRIGYDAETESKRLEDYYAKVLQ